MINFTALSNCRCNYFQCLDSFLPINYVFENAKTYCIISDFRHGSWGLASCIGGNCTCSTGTLYVNDNIASIEELKKYSCFIASNELNSFNSLVKRIPIKFILNHYINKSGLGLQLKDVKDIFCLSNDVIEKTLLEQDKNIWMSSLAIGYVQGKDIFCYPWLNENEIDHYLFAHKIGVIDFLKNNNKIIVVPSSQKNLSLYCDNAIFFEKAEIRYS